MQTYRLYPLDMLGRIAAGPERIEAATDEDALRQARERECVGPVELWRGADFIYRTTTNARP